MNDSVTLLLAACAGGLLGVIFFGGLWWTIRRGLASTRAALWFLGSLVLRTGITLAGFYFVSGGQWPRLLTCLIGFTVARFVVTRFAGWPGKSAAPGTKEVSCAPQS